MVAAAIVSTFVVAVAAAFLVPWSFSSLCRRSSLSVVNLSNSIFLVFFVLSCWFPVDRFPWFPPNNLTLRNSLLSRFPFPLQMILLSVESEPLNALSDTLIYRFKPKRQQAFGALDFLTTASYSSVESSNAAGLFRTLDNLFVNLKISRPQFFLKVNLTIDQIFSAILQFVNKLSTTINA